MSSIEPAAALVIFLTLGVACLVFPGKIQKFYLDYAERSAGAAPANPVVGWIRSRAYVLALRAAGALSLLAAALIAYRWLREISE